MTMKALFLCSQLAGYFANCIEWLYSRNSTQVKVYHKKNSEDAPFSLEKVRFELIHKTDRDFKRFKEESIAFDPDIVYVAGWVDWDYLRVARYFVKKGKVVICGLDNPWTGGFFQRILCLLSPIVIKPCFTYMWVAGRSQFQFARQLKYPKRNILSGVYSADIDSFRNIRSPEYKKELLFVGRFEPIKGIQELYDAFSSLSGEERNGWRLRMIGNGSLKGHFHSMEHIRIEPFMQPHVLLEETKKAGAFILPSRKEPWGVVVHEFAALGVPLILSDSVNAGEEYLIANYNGFVFRSGNIESLRAVLIKLFSLDHDSIVGMGRRSQRLAERYSPDLWAAVFLSPLKVNIDNSTF